MRIDSFLFPALWGAVLFALQVLHTSATEELTPPTIFFTTTEPPEVEAWPSNDTNATYEASPATTTPSPTAINDTLDSTVMLRRMLPIRPRRPRGRRPRGPPTGRRTFRVRRPKRRRRRKPQPPQRVIQESHHHYHHYYHEEPHGHHDHVHHYDDHHHGHGHFHNHPHSHHHGHYHHREFNSDPHHSESYNDYDLQPYEPGGYYDSHSRSHKTSYRYASPNDVRPYRSFPPHKHFHDGPYPEYARQHRNYRHGRRPPSLPPPPPPPPPPPGPTHSPVQTSTSSAYYTSPYSTNMNLYGMKTSFRPSADMLHDSAMSSSYTDSVATQSKTMPHFAESVRVPAKVVHHYNDALHRPTPTVYAENPIKTMHHYSDMPKPMAQYSIHPYGEPGTTKTVHHYDSMPSPTKTMHHYDSMPSQTKTMHHYDSIPSQTKMVHHYDSMPSQTKTVQHRYPDSVPSSAKTVHHYTDSKTMHHYNDGMNTHHFGGNPKAMYTEPPPHKTVFSDPPKSSHYAPAQPYQQYYSNTYRSSTDNYDYNKPIRRQQKRLPAPAPTQPTTYNTAPKPLPRNIGRRPNNLHVIKVYDTTRPTNTPPTTYVFPSPTSPAEELYTSLTPERVEIYTTSTEGPIMTSTHMDPTMTQDGTYSIETSTEYTNVESPIPTTTTTARPNFLRNRHKFRKFVPPSATYKNIVRNRGPSYSSMYDSKDKRTSNHAASDRLWTYTPTTPTKQTTTEDPTNLDIEALLKSDYDKVYVSGPETSQESYGDATYLSEPGAEYQETTSKGNDQADAVMEEFEAYLKSFSENIGAQK